MRFIVILALAIAALVLIKLKKQYRMHITAGFLLVVIVLNVVYNFKSLNDIMPFIRPTNQLTYQPDFNERMEFPDALIPLIIKGKTIYVKDDKEEPYTEPIGKNGMHMFYSYFHYVSTVNYVEGIGAKVVPDEKMNDSVISNELLSDFLDLGYANDMYRNTHIYTGYPKTDFNYFGHYWYYNANMASMHIYINTDGLYESDELVWLWQPISVTHKQEEQEKGLELYKETEYMFIMTKDYYDSKFST